MLSLQSDILATRRRGVDPFRPDCLPAFSIEHNDERHFFYLSVVSLAVHTLSPLPTLLMYSRDIRMGRSNETVVAGFPGWILGSSIIRRNAFSRRVLFRPVYCTQQSLVSSYSIPSVPRIYAVCDRYLHDGSSLRDRTIVKVSLEEKY